MMLKKLRIWGIFFILFCVTGFTVAQDYPILWQDNFDDDDPEALHNVGWIYYPEGDIAGQIIEQREGELFIQAGSYGGMAGVGLVETNGLPHIFLDDDGNITDSTIALSLRDEWSHPNQILTFQINFVRFSTSFFTVATRMPIDSSRGDSDPTEAPAYTLFISPLQGAVMIGRYDNPMQALAPDTWTYFGQAAYAFELEVYYWVKFYLNEGELKTKIWEGELDAEPEEWLIAAVDPNPRVTGKFTMFATLGANPEAGQGDQFILDNIVMRGFSTFVKPESNMGQPGVFSLQQNYPNPFNPSTSISFTLNEKNSTRLVIYNTAGQVIRTLVDSELMAGTHEITWDGRDDQQNPVSSGVYLYKLTSGDHSQCKRMVLMK